MSLKIIQPHRNRIANSKTNLLEKLENFLRVALPIA
jgi:hypothetical protein